MINGQWKYKTNDIYKNLVEFQQKLDNGAANESQTIMTLKLQEDESAQAGSSQKQIKIPNLEKLSKSRTKDKNNIQ